MRPLADPLQPGDHPQRGRLAAAGRADEDEELAVRDLELEVVDGARAAEGLRHVVEDDARHQVSASSGGRRQGEVRGRERRVRDREGEHRQDADRADGVHEQERDARARATRAAGARARARRRAGRREAVAPASDGERPEVDCQTPKSSAT